jgi:hypothetical protein
VEMIELGSASMAAMTYMIYQFYISIQTGVLSHSSSNRISVTGLQKKKSKSAPNHQLVQPDQITKHFVVI